MLHMDPSRPLCWGEWLKEAWVGYCIRPGSGTAPDLGLVLHQAWVGYCIRPGRVLHQAWVKYVTVLDSNTALCSIDLAWFNWANQEDQKAGVSTEGLVLHPGLFLRSQLKLLQYASAPRRIQFWFRSEPLNLSTAQVSNSSPGGPLCLLVIGLFSAPLVHSKHRHTLVCRP